MKVIFIIITFLYSFSPVLFYGQEVEDELKVEEVSVEVVEEEVKDTITSNTLESIQEEVVNDSLEEATTVSEKVKETVIADTSERIQAEVVNDSLEEATTVSEKVEETVVADTSERIQAEVANDSLEEAKEVSEKEVVLEGVEDLDTTGSVELVRDTLLQEDEEDRAGRGEEEEVISDERLQKAKSDLTIQRLESSIKPKIIKLALLFTPSFLKADKSTVLPIKLKGLDDVTPSEEDVGEKKLAIGKKTELSPSEKEEYSMDVSDGKEEKGVQADTASRTISPLISAVEDSSVSKLDARINPMLFSKQDKSSQNALDSKLENIFNDDLGVGYYIPFDWKEYKYRKKNVIAYFVKGDIRVLISVGRSMYKDLDVWARLQEALFFGRNYIDPVYQVADKSLTVKFSVDQAYFGKYDFEGIQYNTGYYKRGIYQFHIIITHPYKALSEDQVFFINYMMSNFLAREPLLKLPDYSLGKSVSK